ncbi:MAG TPA: hypothetical protein VMS98_12990, partial [Thermoanaerobaculia bacterium]|nr:hypothetical protein [Thermoanaerobaculia bacterium]
MKRRSPLWLVIALTLGLPELGAQQSKDTVLHIPPGSDLQATLENQTAKVKVGTPPSEVRLAALRFIEVEGSETYETDELLNDVTYFLEADYQLQPAEVEVKAQLSWAGGALEVPLSRSLANPKLFRSGPLLVPTLPGVAAAAGAPPPLELGLVGEEVVTARLLDKQATARVQPFTEVAGISFRDHLGNALPERVEKGKLVAAQIQAGEPYVGVIEYEAAPNGDEQPVTLAVGDVVHRENAKRVEGNDFVFETDPRRAVKAGDVITLYAHGHAATLKVVEPRIEIFVRRAGQGRTRSNVPSLTTDEMFHVDVFVPPQTATEIGETLRVEFLTKAKGGTASLRLKENRSQRGPTIYTHDDPVSLDTGGVGEGRSLNWLVAGVVPRTLESLFGGGIDMAKMKSEKVDTLVVSYGDAKAEIPVYWSWRQRQIAEIAAAMDALRQFYSAGLSNPKVSRAGKEQLHKRLNLIKNYDQVMAYQGEEFDDIRRLIAARAYFDMLQTDPSAWNPDYIPTTWEGSRKNRFGVLIGSRMEGEMLNHLEDAAKQEYFERFARTMRDATIGLYQVVADSSGVNQLLILRTGT